jgi:hypothetical protein
MSPCHHENFEQAVSPGLGFLLDPFALLGLVACEPSKVATFSHNFQTEALETSLGFLFIVILCNEDALQRLSPRGTAFLKLLKAKPNLLEASASPRVISMPGLADARQRWHFQSFDEREQPHSTHDHHQWVTLGHSFFAQNGKEQIVTCLDHQNGKVAAAIDNASRPRCPFMARQRAPKPQQSQQDKASTDRDRGNTHQASQKVADTLIDMRGTTWGDWLRAVKAGNTQSRTKRAVQRQLHLFSAPETKLAKGAFDSLCCS